MRTNSRILLLFIIVTGASYQRHGVIAFGVPDEKGPARSCFQVAEFMSVMQKINR